MPSLLLRRPPARLGSEQDRRSDANLVSDLSLTKLLKRRVQFAETGQWDVLLSEYLCDRREYEQREKNHIEADSAQPRDDDDRIFERVIAMVHDDCVSRAKRELLAQPKVLRDEITASEIDRLACVPIDDAEEEELMREIACASALSQPVSVPKIRTIKRRLHSLRSGAAHGPSGWRNSHILKIAALDNGLDALRGFVRTIVLNLLVPDDSELWQAAVLEPVDQGESSDPDAARGRKLRPIGLSEALVKLAENAKLDEDMPALRAVLEPAQLGAGTPDGVAIAIRVLRGWAKDIEEEASFEDAITGTDLENAFCRMFRSKAIRAARRHLPQIAPILAGAWATGRVRVWQRCSGSGWRLSWSWRGGWQGSRLTQTAFCLSLNDAFGDTDMCKSGVVARVVIADDFYLVGPAAQQARMWPQFEAALANYGHRLRRNKCMAWAPLLDDLAAKDVVGLAPGAQSLFDIVPRVVGGLPLLGSAAQGDRETFLGPYARVAEPAMKRAREAAGVAERLCDLIAARPNEFALQAAWSILQKCVARALDFDSRLCPAWALSGARDFLQDAIRKVISAAVGADLSADEVEQIFLPGELGGVGLRDLPDSTLHAAYWATWTAHAADVKRVAAALGRPLAFDVDSGDAVAAAEALHSAGVTVTNGCPCFVPESEASYSAGPWAVDRAADQVFRYAGEFGLVAVLPVAIGAGHEHPPGQRRRILGRILRGLDALRATRLARARTAHGRDAMLLAGGPGSGTF